jgi:hypothetical protein
VGRPQLVVGLLRIELVVFFFYVVEVMACWMLLVLVGLEYFGWQGGYTKVILRV